MPQPPDDDGLSTLPNGRLLSHLRRIKPDRELAGRIIRELASREGEDAMSINEIADQAKIPRSTAQRWAKNAAEEKQ